MQADPVQIQQVIMNLCTNAFHAMSEKGGDPDDQPGTAAPGSPGSAAHDRDGTRRLK